MILLGRALFSSGMMLEQAETRRPQITKTTALCTEILHVALKGVTAAQFKLLPRSLSASTAARYIVEQHLRAA
jgi:hypothetical protein